MLDYRESFHVNLNVKFKLSKHDWLIDWITCAKHEYKSLTTGIEGRGEKL